MLYIFISEFLIFIISLIAFYYCCAGILNVSDSQINPLHNVYVYVQSEGSLTHFITIDCAEGLP